MKRIMQKLNKKGFSLIELMVVVAIIAILASFAIPQYQSFQAKARQKEGLTLLNSYYVAAKATEAEQGFFPGNFEGTGFNPAGQIHYRVLVVDGALQPSSGPNNDGCINTGAPTACTTGFADWVEVAGGTFRVAAAVNCTPATDSNAGTFIACASAQIRSNSTADADSWSINQVKGLVNTNDGIE